MATDDKPKMGRPPIEIDWVEFDKLLNLQATKKEIAGWFNCSEDTLENKIREKHDMTFSAYFDLRSQGGKISLRRKQFQTAMSGNVSMLIFLGKQWLGQADKMESSGTTKHEVEVDYGPWSLRDPNEVK